MNIKTSRLGIFIDESNIYHSQKTLGWRVDYLKLKEYLKTFGHISILNLYTSILNKGVLRTKRFRVLMSIGFSIIHKELKFIRSKDGGCIKKGNLDIELALDAYRSMNKYDTFIIFSGDSDFGYLIDLLKSRDKSVLVFSTKEHVSRELIDKGDMYIDLKKLVDTIKLI